MKNWEKLKNHTQIPKSQFLKILQFCLTDNNYFKYDTKIYSQTFGMPMGNPLSPTIADIVLDHLLDETIDKLKKSNIKIKFIVKYVDDMIAIINKKDKDIILKTFNEYHSKLKFTIETENNNQIPFLETKLIKNNNQISFDWYSKPISSGRMINYMSSQPIKYKINTAINLINKVFDISDNIYHKNNTLKIRNILQINNYPNTIINELINNKLQQLKNQNNIQQTSKAKSGNPKFYSVTYVPHLTDNLTLNNTISIEREKTSFAHRSNSTLNTIFTNTKPRIDKKDQHNVVYQIPCKECNRIYIGTTKRKLAVRLSEHEADIRRRRTTTALSQHMTDNDHMADFENVKILDKENRTSTRYTLEGLRIQQNIKTTMNHQEDIDNISSIYGVAINNL